MTCLQRTFKAHQLTEQRIVAAVGFIAVLMAQQSIQLSIRVECLVIGKDHLHAATPHPWTRDLHQARCHARTTLRKVIKALLNHVVCWQSVEFHHKVTLDTITDDFQHPFTK